jgi:plasmid stabilization system protein ParE
VKSRFIKPAEDELAEALDHYNGITAGLGDRFLGEVREAVRLIEEFPRNSPVIGREVRRKVVFEFPYSLFYVVAPEEVLILAVAHQKRRPLYWKHRIPRTTGS